MRSTNVSGGAGEDIISVPVPKKYFPQVMQFVGKLMEADIPSPQLLPEPSAQRSPFGFAETNKDQPHSPIAYDEATFQRLRATLKNKAALTALDLTSDKPNTPVYVEDIMEAIGASHGEVSAGMGALTKAIKKAFSIDRNNVIWPAPFHWDNEKQRAFYMMEPEVAKAWKGSQTA
jgi:hypothetical protein